MEPWAQWRGMLKEILAAATSTGGINNKLPGRVGDSPSHRRGNLRRQRDLRRLLHGRWRIFYSRSGRASGFCVDGIAWDVVGGSGRTRPGSMREKLGGTGGLIAVDKNGNVALPFNTSGMYRGYLGEDGKFVIEIYK